MTSVAKFALPLLFLAACGQDPIAPPPMPQTGAQGAAATDQRPANEGGPQVAVAPQRQEVQRESVTDRGNAHSDAPQGVKGRILLPNGEQAAGVQLMLPHLAPRSGPVSTRWQRRPLSFRRAGFCS